MNSAIGARPLLDVSAGGVGSWNTDIDYLDFYENAYVEQRLVAERLYEDLGAGGATLRSDLDRINDQARISGDQEAIDYWSAHPRAHSGDPGIPMLQMHSTGDSALPPVLM